jgi:hypothetical protein
MKALSGYLSLIRGAAKAEVSPRPAMRRVPKTAARAKMTKVQGISIDEKGSPRLKPSPNPISKWGHGDIEKGGRGPRGLSLSGRGRTKTDSFYDDDDSRYWTGA